MQNPYSLSRRHDWITLTIITLLALIALAIAYNVSAGIHAIKCGAPIDQLSWIGAGYCDRMAEWIDHANVTYLR